MLWVQHNTQYGSHSDGDYHYKSVPAEINDKHNLDHGDQVLLKMPITIMVSLGNGSDV